MGGYTLVRPLGLGGAGTVWEAADEGGNKVALKLLHPISAGDNAPRARILRQVQLVNRIPTKQVAKVLDVEADALVPFVVTELIEGPTLEEMLAGGPLPEEDALQMGRMLAGVLEEVHGVGVAHRDLKPSNVVVEDGLPVLIDFDLSRTGDDTQVTAHGIVLGTPGYLAPELLVGGASDLAAFQAGDRFAWAATLLKMMTGESPFGAGRVEQVARRVAEGDINTAGLEPWQAAAFQKALHPAPASRISPQELLDALAAAPTGRELGAGRDSSSTATDTWGARADTETDAGGETTRTWATSQTLHMTQQQAGATPSPASIPPAPPPHAPTAPAPPRAPSGGPIPMTALPPPLTAQDLRALSSAVPNAPLPDVVGSTLPPPTVSPQNPPLLSSPTADVEWWPVLPAPKPFPVFTSIAFTVAAAALPAVAGAFGLALVAGLLLAFQVTGAISKQLVKSRGFGGRMPKHKVFSSVFTFPLVSLVALAGLAISLLAGSAAAVAAMWVEATALGAQVTVPEVADWFWGGPPEAILPYGYARLGFWLATWAGLMLAWVLPTFTPGRHGFAETVDKLAPSKIRKFFLILLLVGLAFAAVV